MEVLFWLSTQPQFAAIPVIILTGSPFMHEIKEAYRLGAKTFFLKPVEGADLEALLRVILDYCRVAERRRRAEDIPAQAA